ncbi:MAG: choline dehydrogenase-like flavoprotein [Lentisphaeria bacterium]|jgi:choline dehydrogenase-like flavoprotein
MLYDFSTGREKIRSIYDFCICESGAAGIALANKLANAGKTVILLEGGGREYSSESQKLYEATTSGFWPDYLTNFTRLRFLGGTTNHWAGRCKPFVEHDFEQKPGFALPGWPIPFSEMERYLEPAMEILDLDTKLGFYDSFETPIRSNSFEPDPFQLSAPTRFAQKYAVFLNSHRNIDVFVNANVTHLQAAPNGRILHVDASDFSLNKKSINAGAYVLAMGAIENPRLLLHSSDIYSRGIGNASDMVGRCFMEHYNVQIGEFAANSAVWNGKSIMNFFPVVDFLKEFDIGASNLYFRILDERGGRQNGRLAPLKYMLQDLSCDFDLSESLQFLFAHQCAGLGIITSLTEQEPNLDSRVSLTETRDDLGMKKCHLHISMSDYDRNTIRKLSSRLAKEMAQANVGRIKLADFILDETKEILAVPHAHHMGTTRMAAEPEHGVVDKNTKVFGIDNLYIAGASVFPTGGGNNPTLPLVQLTLRLADHLLTAS